MALSLSASRPSSSQVNLVVSGSYTGVTQYRYQIQGADGEWYNKTTSAAKSVTVSVSTSSAYYCRVQGLNASGTVLTTAYANCPAWTTPTYATHTVTVNSTGVTYSYWYYDSTNTYRTGSSSGYAYFVARGQSGNYAGFDSIAVSSGYQYPITMTSNTSAGGTQSYTYNSATSVGINTTYNRTVNFSAVPVPVSTTYKIVYNANGGSGGPATTSKTSTASSETLTVSSSYPTLDGYRFLGWSTSSTATTPNYYGGNSITLYNYSPTITLYAVWALNEWTYTISYDATTNGGTGAPSKQSYGPTTDTSHTFTLRTGWPSKAGCTFLGWGLTSTQTSGLLAPGATFKLTTPTTDITLYAIFSDPSFSYSLTYNANGGSGAPTGKSGTSSSTYVEWTIASGTPYKYGYRFLGWSKSSTASIGQWSAGDTITIVYTDPDIVLYAVWEELPVYNYRLYYNSNGGSGSPQAQEVGPTYSTNAGFVVSTDQPTKSGYEFLGWSTSSTAKTPDYYGGETIILYAPDVTLTLFAVWQIETYYDYSLSYDGNGTGFPLTQTARSKNTSYTFQVSYTEPTWYGHNFLGWSKSSTGTVAQYKGGDSVVVTAANPDAILYSVWEEKTKHTYSIVYSANGGSGAPPTEGPVVSYEDSYPFTISSIIPYWEGHEFLGWTRNSTIQEVEYVGGDAINVYAAVPTVILYAVWRTLPKYIYKIEFDTGGSQTPIEPLISPETTASSYEFEIWHTEPYREDWDFLGWATSSTGEPEYQPGDKITLYGAYQPQIVLYGKWKRKFRSYTLSYSANGGSGTPDSQTDRNDQGSATFTVSTTVPVWPGHRFLSWGGYAPGSEITITDDVTLYAQWFTYPTFVWTEDDDTYLVSGKVVSGVILASKWNTFNSYIKTYINQEYVYDQVLTGQRITSTIFNQPANELNLELVIRGQVITPSHFIDLKNTLNGILSQLN